jgi:predicted transcriptional regulator
MRNYDLNSYDDRSIAIAVYNPLHHTDADALAMLLPIGEAEIMRWLWARGPLKLRPLYEQLAAQRAVALTTVKTTADRLVDTGLLRRTKQLRCEAYTYKPTIGERDLVTQTIHRLLDCVVRDCPSAIAT